MAIDNDIENSIENYFDKIHIINSELNDLLDKYIIENKFDDLVDLYYSIQTYSVNMAIEFALKIIKKEGKYFEETFHENVELEIIYHGNYETGKIIKKFIKETKDEIRIIYEKLYDILVEKYNKMGLDIDNIIKNNEVRDNCV